MPLSRSPGSIICGWCRCLLPYSASSAFHEPPYAEPHVRWCGRATGVTRSPTRLVRSGSSTTMWRTLGIVNISQRITMMNDTAVQEPIATTEEFKAALLATRDWMGISPTQLQMLQAQCRAPECTITAAQIHKQLGLKSVAAARSEYAAFARAVADKLGYAPPRAGKSPIRWWYALSVGRDR